MLNKALVFLLLSCSISFGSTLPSDTKIEVFDDFTGGLNTDLPSSKLPKNQSPNMRNVIIDDGDIHKIGGYYTVGSTPTLSKVNLIYVYVKDDGSKEYIVSDSSIVLSTKDFKVYTLLREGLNTNFKINCFSARGKCWIGNGIDAWSTYDASTVTVLDGGFYGGKVVANAPRCRYGAYWQDRVWLYNSNTDASQVFWSALTSTDTIPIAIAPDSECAWKNDEFSRYIGRGDGQIGTGMKVYLGRLQLFKERSIYSMQGNDDTSYNEVRTIGGYGFTDNDSVVELDGYLYGKGQDSIYQYNGGQMVRITDDIVPDMEAIKTSVNKILSESWNTDTKFNSGNGSSISINNGMISGPFPDMSITNYVTTTSVSSYGYNSIKTVNTSLSIPYPMTIDSIYSNACGKAGGVDINVSVLNLANNTSSYFRYFPISICDADPPININDAKYKVNVATLPFGFDGNGGIATWNHFVALSSEIVSSGVRITWASNGYIMKDTINNFVVDDVVLQGSSSSSYVSNISTFSSLMNSWSYFNVDSNNGGGSISFFYKTATSPVNITTYPWNPILPNVLINAKTTDNYIQWSSTAVSLSTTSIPSISNVTINAILGGSSDSNPIGTEWKSRYWCAVSTVSDGSTSLMYIKSKITNSGGQNRWMVGEGINLKSIVRDGDYLYGGASTCGVIYRLDTGLNFNGRPIQAWWDTRDTTMDQPFFDKTLLEYSVDMERQSGATFTIGTALDGGAFTNYNFSVDGSGRIVKSYSLPLSYKKGNMFRWRLGNSELDKDMSLYNFGVFYVPTSIHTNNQ